MARRNCDKEYDRVQQLAYENRKLKRENANLRKQLARMDLDRHSYVRDIVEEHLADEHSDMDSTKLLKKLQDQWRCHECGTGTLEIIVYSKMGQPHYFRQCSECTHRTLAKPYHAGVEGVKKPIPIDPKAKPGKK